MKARVNFHIAPYEKTDVPLDDVFQVIDLAFLQRDDRRSPAITTMDKSISQTVEFLERRNIAQRVRCV